MCPEYESDEPGQPIQAKTPVPAGANAILAHCFHREVELAIGLYLDKHYDDAVRKASQRYINRVNELTDHPGGDGVGLINKSFSEDAPLLAFSDRETMVERDEHNGYRFLAVGLAQALRNVVTHDDNYGLGSEETLEWLAFISAMHRRLDGAVQIPREQSDTSA